MLSFEHYIKDIQKLKDCHPEIHTQLKKELYDVIGACMEVHRDMGPFLNEYMYQEALDICLEEHGISGENKIREYYFKAKFHGKQIEHPHKVDFFVNQRIFIECKAVMHLGNDHRQQLWNYMRLAKVPVGILYNFAPFRDEVEKYYLDLDKQILYVF